MTSQIPKAKLLHRSIIAAQPSYFIISAESFSRGTSSQAYKEPIIAWHIEVEEFQDEFIDICYPVTLEGVQKDNDIAILQPDGSITIPNSRYFNNEADFLDYHLEKRNAAK